MIGVMRLLGMFFIQAAKFAQLGLVLYMALHRAPHTAR